MAHSVTITTPMPTLDELGKDLGLTKAEQKFIISLVDKKVPKRSQTYAFKTRSTSSGMAKNGSKKVSNMTRKTNGSARKIA